MIVRIIKFNNTLWIVIIILLVVSMEPIAAFEEGSSISGNDGLFNHDPCNSNDDSIEFFVDDPLSQNEECIENPLPPIVVVPDNGIEYPKLDPDLTGPVIEYKAPNMPSDVDIEGYYPTGCDVQSIGGTPWEHTAGNWIKNIVSVALWVFTCQGFISTGSLLASGGSTLIISFVVGSLIGGGLGYVLAPFLGLSHSEGAINGFFIGSTVGLAIGSVIMAANGGPVFAAAAGSAWTLALVTAGLKSGCVTGALLGALNGATKGHSIGSTAVCILKGAAIGVLLGGIIGVFMGLLARLITGNMVILPPEPPAPVPPEVKAPEVKKEPLPNPRLVEEEKFPAREGSTVTVADIAPGQPDPVPNEENIKWKPDTEALWPERPWDAIEPSRGDSLPKHVFSGEVSVEDVDAYLDMFWKPKVPRTDVYPLWKYVDKFNFDQGAIMKKAKDMLFALNKAPKNLAEAIVSYSENKISYMLKAMKDPGIITRRSFVSLTKEIQMDINYVCKKVIDKEWYIENFKCLEYLRYLITGR